MKTFLIRSFAIAALAFGASAHAADLGARAPVYKASVAPAFNWSGFYIGVNAGGGWNRSDAATSTVFSPVGYFAASSIPAVAAAGAQSINSSGATAGGQIGYNWQVGQTVLGLEADFGYFGMRGSSRASGVYPCCAPTGFTVNSAMATDWLFTARPRLGFAADTMLFYVTGGVAMTNLRGNFSFTDTFASATESAAFSQTKAGWTAGAGLEWAMSPAWSLKAEYLHLDFGGISGTSTNLVAIFAGATPFPSNVFSHSVNLRSDIVRVGVNYHFGK